MTIQIGTRICYEGDRRNASGPGVVTRFYHGGEWDKYVRIKLDDGRELRVRVARVSPEQSGRRGRG